MGKRMRQDERPRAGPGEVAATFPPMPDETAVVDNVDIERARPPGPAAATSGTPFDLFQNSQQGVGREARVEQRDGVYVSGLPGMAEGRGLVERRDRNEVDIEPLNLA